MFRQIISILRSAYYQDMYRFPVQARTYPWITHFLLSKSTALVYVQMPNLFPERSNSGKCIRNTYRRIQWIEAACHKSPNLCCFLRPDSWWPDAWRSMYGTSDFHKENNFLLLIPAEKKSWQYGKKKNKTKTQPKGSDVNHSKCVTY